MAVTAKAYAGLASALGNKEVNFLADALKVMLCTSAYVPSQGTHKYKSSVTAEVVGTAYTAGGAALTAVTAATAGNVLTLDAADSSWAASTITARYAVVYDSTPATDATRPLIAYVDFGVDVISNSGTFLITWDVLGIVTITAA